MNSIIIQTGDMLVNTYILHNEDSKDALIIDPGGSYKKIKQTLEEYGLMPKAVLLTHGHFDHIGAVAELKEDFKMDIYIHPDDAELLTDPKKNLSAFFFWSPTISVPADRFLKDGERFNIAGIAFTVLHTPGHSMGSVIFLTEKAAFTGDTLFRLSVGRMDFYGSDENKMNESLIRIKKEIPPQCLIFPGHGESSIFAYELENNPYLRG